MPQKITARAKSIKKAITPKKASAKAAAPRISKTANGTIKIAATGDAARTVTVTFTSTAGTVTTAEKELQLGDTLNDFRVVVALVGGSHTGVIGGEHVIAETPGTTFA